MGVENLPEIKNFDQHTSKGVKGAVLQDTLGSVEALCQLIWQWEEDFDLLDWHVAGVYPWQASRMKLYYWLANVTGVLENPAPKRTLPEKVHFKKGRLWWQSLRYSPFRGLKGVEAMVFTSQRVSVSDGHPVDIYIDPVIDNYRQQGKRVAVMELPSAEGYPLHTNGQAVTPLIALAYHKVLRRHQKSAQRKAFRAFTQEDDKKIQELEAVIKQACGVQLNLKAYFLSVYQAFQVEYDFYYQLFKRREPKQVEVVCAYLRAPLVAAAKTLHIPVVEHQHGTVSPYHLGYSYPNRSQSLAYFPDVFKAWGSYWTKTTSLPFCSLSYPGFAHFRKQRARYAMVDKNTKQLVVISQTALSTPLAELVLKHANSLAQAGYHILYKLHPLEYSTLETRPAMEALGSHPAVTLVKEADMYQLLAESTVALGVFSTALFEAIGFGCHLLPVELPGLAYLAPLIQQYGLPILRADSDPKALIKQAKMIAIPAEDLF